MGGDAVAYAISGQERCLALSVDSNLLEMRGVAIGDASAEGDLVAAVVLTWSSRSEDSYELFRRASSAALRENRVHLAVAALERLAHHAILFGDVPIAQSAINDAVALATVRRQSEWAQRALASASRLAFDVGESQEALRLMELAIAENPSVPPVACAPLAVQLAIERGDDAAVGLWSGPAVIEAALHGTQLPDAAAATVAMLIAGAHGHPHRRIATAVRRLLLAVTDPSNLPEMFTTIAKYGDPEQAHYGLKLFAACVASDRVYVRAHRLLAQAYLAFRCGRYAECSDTAGEAARAFSTMGLRRWTDDSMALLVRHSTKPSNRGIHPSLTRREEQIASLVR
ncbi:MAG: hypothetical protein JO030_04125, partial [Candidatus Eremiobacteraeota bacterium]|nr:hypothetical protein [Candidatus Eremiobacteraeota bacterium]